MISLTSTLSLRKHTATTFPVRYAFRRSPGVCVRDRREWQLSEEEFWKRYFQSKLFNAHRASIRSSATQHVVKDDPIFDKYLERDDDGGLHDPHIVRSFLVVRRIGAKTTARRSSRYICRPSRHSRRSRRGEDRSTASVYTRSSSF